MAKAAPAKSWLHACCTITAGGAKVHSLQSTWPRYRASWWKASCLATRKARSPAHRRARKAVSSRPKAAPYSLMKLATCRWRRKHVYCASCRKANTRPLGGAHRSKPTCASSRQRIVISNRKFGMGSSARICFTDSTSCPFAFPPYASGWRTWAISCVTFCGVLRVRALVKRRSRQVPSSASRPTHGTATFASWKILYAASQLFTRKTYSQQRSSTRN